jgi:hypothetical protein
MRTVTSYQCEKCRKIYPTSHEAFLCESGHYGLTVEEYGQWLALKKLAEDAGRISGITKNEETEAAFDEVVQKLLSFEKEHHLEGF